MSVAIFEASAADLATPSFGTGIPYASQTSLPSGAVRLVRLSALTRSSILRTASLEFDIGILLKVTFLVRLQRIGSACGPQNPDFPARFQSRFPLGANAGPHPLRHVPEAADRPVMAFGMPAVALS